MNDVLQECGGFLRAWVNEWGYIYTFAQPNTPHDSFDGRIVVHKETRELLPDVSFTDGKLWCGGVTGLPHMVAPIVLELSPQGGGQVIWVRKEVVETVRDALKRWSGCYGTWPIRGFTGAV